MPSLFAIIQYHVSIRINPRLPLAGAHRKAETLPDDRAEIWQLLNVLDWWRLVWVRNGFFELVSQAFQDPWGRKNMNTGYLKWNTSRLRMARTTVGPG